MARADKILFGLFAVTLALYLVVFGTAFADLPLNVPNWHLALLLYFHFLPMCFLQLLLCRRVRVLWRLLVPLALLAVPGVIFLNTAGWMVMGWIFFLWWCMAPALGSALGWLLWTVLLRKRGRTPGKTPEDVL